MSENVNETLHASKLYFRAADLPRREKIGCQSNEVSCNRCCLLKYGLLKQSQIFRATVLSVCY